MSTETETTGGVPSQTWEELQAALDRLCHGIPDPGAARRSRDRMDHLREENRRRLSVQDIAVDLIRQSRERR
jgi:hypothetical protein